LKGKLFLLSQLLRRDLSSRYAGSFGGPFWALLNPLILCLLYAFVFEAILRMKPPPGFEGGYAEFLLAGLLPWLGCQEALLRSTTSITDQAQLVKKMQFPVELLVGSSILAALVLEVVGLAILACWVAATGRGGALQPGTFVVALAFEALLLAGPSLVLASLNVFFRDLPQLLAPVLTIVLWLTPILYPEAQGPASLRAWFGINPFRDLVALFRQALFGGPGPDPVRVALWSGVSAAALAGGLWLFRRSRRVFSDLL
jgi:lipopolysaccharide transport system permease protein